MPHCVICESKFYYQTQDSQHETCDCGFEVTRGEWRDMDPAEFAEKTAAYQAECDREANGDTK